MIEHIVLLKLKDGVTKEQTQALHDGLIALKEKGSIPGMEELTAGYNNSPEGKNHDYNWGFTIRFTNEAARDAYLLHPDHKALGQTFIRPIVDDVLVFDYEA
ncbi:MAG: Dabb family protein [Candidatus Latescibacteria bacterium]|jgi:hypothetical protein|nr:Dabb family protein [Candidatus Latescibacterota bacterium]